MWHWLTVIIRHQICATSSNRTFVYHGTRSHPENFIFWLFKRVPLDQVRQIEIFSFPEIKPTQRRYLFSSGTKEISRQCCVNSCYGSVSPCYGVNPCYGISPYYDVSPCYGAWSQARGPFVLIFCFLLCLKIYPANISGVAAHSNMLNGVVLENALLRSLSLCFSVSKLQMFNRFDRSFTLLAPHIYTLTKKINLN